MVRKPRGDSVACEDALISVKGLHMEYPIPWRIRERICRPFEKRVMHSALHDITLSVHAGEKIGFLGPNGAGKSTLLKMFGGLLYPTRGSVSVGGLDTRKHNREIREKVGFVLNEDRSFYWRLTGEENLAFFGALDDLYGQRLKKTIQELMEFVGLAWASGKRVSDYSSGMRQRLAIARGLLSDPEILILDEPTRTLDPIGAAEVRKLLCEAGGGRRKRTILIATHQFEEVESVCDRVCVIRKGRVAGFQDMLHLRATETSLNSFYIKCMTN
jgi:ABC-2 type transport system ATP-binding protein